MERYERPRRRREKRGGERRRYPSAAPQCVGHPFTQYNDTATSTIPLRLSRARHYNAPNQPRPSD